MQLQAAKQPHADLLGSEVEASVHSAEHLLWLTQRSRATLSGLSETYRRLTGLHAALLTLAPAASGSQQQQQQQPAAVPPQELCREWHERQRSQLATLLQQADETSELLAAAGSAETAAVPRKQLQQGAQQAAVAAGALRECSVRLAHASQGAVLLEEHDSNSTASSFLFLPASVLAALQANSEALHSLQQQLEGVLQEQRRAHAPLPGWAELCAAVAAAAQESAAASAATLHPGGSASLSEDQLEQQQQQLADHLEGAVAAALVWAQNAKPAAAAAAGGNQDLQQQQQQQLQQEGEEMEVEAEADVQQVPLPQLLLQLEAALCLHKTAELGGHAAQVLRTVAAASNQAQGAGASQQVAAAAAGVAPLLGLLLSALRQLGLQYLAVHKAVAKLCYITASLFSGLVQEGFCMPEGTEGEYSTGALADKLRAAT